MLNLWSICLKLAGRKHQESGHIAYTGPFKTWEEANSVSVGWNSPSILKKVVEGTQQVLDGSKIYERDGTAFASKPSLDPMSEMLHRLLRSEFAVVDFGGGLGSTFITNRQLIEELKVSWVILEQPTFVTAGKLLKEQYGLGLEFTETVDEIRLEQIDLAIFSSVLQYIQDWQGLLTKILAFSPEYILVDRTPVTSEKSRIWVQLNSDYYEDDVNYPVWEINLTELCDAFINYVLVDSWSSAFDPTNYKGFLFKRNDLT